MKYSNTIKINFRGGIISPGSLYNILVAAGRAKLTHVSFGLRQQLLVETQDENTGIFMEQLEKLGTAFEVDAERFPNVTSSYPAEEVFISNTWLSEGVYKDVFESMDYHPMLKINVCDSNQSFTPILTGNINWVACPDAPHYWHLFIRFPKTNAIYEWNQLVYTNDLARMSRHIEMLMFNDPKKFYDNLRVNGDELFALVMQKKYITMRAPAPLKLPGFNLPYYEGLNRYQEKYWLGIYRRDELFAVDFLKELCRLCLDTKIGQLCSTPWKSLIIKNIEEKDRFLWNALLDKYQVNVRHAANELNFQVEDACPAGLALKHYLVKHLHDDDTRSFGISIGIKTRRKSEVFGSILVRRRPLLSIFGKGFFHLYDILCAHQFNPNERTGAVYSYGNIKWLLSEQLRRAIISFYHYRHNNRSRVKAAPVVKREELPPQNIFQCSQCLTVYDEAIGETGRGIGAGTRFDQLPPEFCCELCDAPKTLFNKTTKPLPFAQTIQ